MPLEDMLSSPSLPDGVRRAVETMRANVGHRWSLARLAAVAQVSPRTLQRQFMRFLGKSPHAVWQEIGLEQARYELLRGAGADASATWRCGAVSRISAVSPPTIAAIIARARLPP